MSETVQTASIGRAEAGSTDDLDEGLVISPTDVGERLWRFFISMRTGLTLILAGAVGLVAPCSSGSGASGDPQAYATWLESLRPKYGGWTGILDTLGLFSIFSSIWFRGIMVLLMTSVLACSLNRAPHLWKLTIHPRTDMSESFLEHAPLRMQATGRVEPESAATEVESAFRRRHFRTIVRADGDTIHLYADHFRWGPFGTVIAHLSLVVILIGALVGSAFGFRNDGFRLPSDRRSMSGMALPVCRGEELL
jgi:cytochrome c biogenesis protein